MNRIALLTIVFCAFIARLFLIWIGRPEFVGWFNHTYYYFVQTRELLESGKFAFPDLPLLFQLYAVSAKILTWIGLDIQTAIIISTRFWMCLIPALIPISIYGVLRKVIEETKTARYFFWALIFISAFYPLTLVHHPEFLQKNLLGLLLLSILIYLSKQLIEKQNTKDVIVFALTFLLIIFTHFGTTFVSILYICSILVSIIIHKRKPWSNIFSLSLILGLVISLSTFYYLDIHRFERISSYIIRIVDSSIFGLLFSENDPDKFSTILMFFLPLGFTIILYSFFLKGKQQIHENKSIFWLGNIIFFYSLVLPIYEPLLLARFVNFLTLPLIIIIAYTIQNSLKSIFWKKTIIGISVFVTILIATGDIISLIMHNKNKEEAYKDLLKMKELINFSERDLILSRNGVEHIANWFLNSKSSLITSFNRQDFKKYNRIFILNPIEGEMKLQNVTNKENQKYNYMLSNIDEPSDGIVMYSSSYIKLIHLTNPPKNWKYDHEDNWIGY